ncbi:hypothetical protein GobsT_71310 [Gemmata obscuriglobus]|uniref:Uncharacterized protein n=1 Tax=Gemmata obscuriglobus TaxID=114 RepID=A0A2Z3HDG0_9BACT|nr:hypothetical protein [Gemmata obscuriglobus]AWM41766.1 hypothetical protein C1280_35400 [Gemmata obscuriglobus]QEG32278.1 hypothetical protein GobsT_71310 [Gemmata obscuriglobus]VTS11634.1 unnamed protein product [Gemmata obscuriglobus UQM 2246]
MNDPALAAALQLLAGAISGLPQAIIFANQQAERDTNDGGWLPIHDRPQPVIVVGPKPLPVSGVAGGAPPQPTPAGPADPAPSRLGSMFAPVLAKFAAVAGPMAVLGAALGSVTSGFGTLGKSVQLFAATVAPVLLPATVLLATAFTSAAAVLTNAIGPGLEGFLTTIIGLGIPVLVTFIGAVQTVASALADLAKWVEDNFGNRDRNGERITDPRATEGDRRWFGLGWDTVSDPERNTQAYFRLFDEELRKLTDADWKDPNAPWYTTRNVDRENEARRLADLRYAEGERGGAGADPSSPQAMVLSALRDVAKSFALSVGPKASISGLEGVGKSVQMAALNGDPIEQKMLRVQQSIATTLMRAVDALTAGGGVWLPGEGDFGARPGGGGAFEGGSF